MVCQLLDHFGFLRLLLSVASHIRPHSAVIRTNAREVYIRIS